MKAGLLKDGLKIVARSEREVVMTRDFAAPRRLVFDALTKPELVKRWLGVRAGWTLPVCEIDLRVGGKYRYVWRKASKNIDMGVSGVFREIVVPERLVHTEKFDDAWYPGEALITATLTEASGRTTLAYTMLYESTAARDAVLASPMESGVAEGYAKLDELLAEIA